MLMSSNIECHLLYDVTDSCFVFVFPILLKMLALKYVVYIYAIM